MLGLICNQCLQVPYVEFLPGLMVKFFCHEKNLIRHIDLDKSIENLFTLKCCKKNCRKESQDFHVLYSSIICDKCLKDTKNINQVTNNYIKSDSLLTKCISHFTKFSYYDDESHSFFCEFCNISKASKKLNEYEKKFKKEFTDKLDEFVKSKNKIIYPKYYELLIKRIIETYENFGKRVKFNVYYNLFNLNNFLLNYFILAPFCQKCREIFHISNINNKISEIEDNTFEKEAIINFSFSCKCRKLNHCNIKDFENLINSNICENCNNTFKQEDLIYDIIFEKFFCQYCAKKQLSLDYIRFNEFIYICWIHKKTFDYYCSKCWKLFCSECKNLDNHEFVKLNDEQKEYPYLNSVNWFIKLKNHGLLNLKYNNKDCKAASKNIQIELEKLIKIVEKEKEKKKSFENKNNLEQISSIITQNISLIDLYIYNTNFISKIINLESKNNQLILSSEAILKELNEKNGFINLISMRNIFQHLIINMIKKNYFKFEAIQEDFRILYESYKYLNYEYIKEKDNHGKSVIEKKLLELVSKFIKLIQNYFTMKLKKIFIARLRQINEEKKLNLNDKLIKKIEKKKKIQDYFEDIMDKNHPKIYYNEKIKILNTVFENEIKSKIDEEKFSVINDYNRFLLSQNLINNKIKFNEIKELINSLEKNDIPEDFEKMAFKKYVKITGIIHNDTYGYINEKSINSEFIKELLKNSQENENYQYLFIKKEEEKDFLTSVKCKNDIEFYFLYLLIQNIIKRIGNIVHQNDKEFKFVFKDNSCDLNKRKYKLIIDNHEKNGYKFIEVKSEDNIKSVSLTNSIMRFSDFSNFSSNFFSIYIPELKALIGDQKIKKLKNKIEQELNLINMKNKISNIIKNIADSQKELTFFNNKYKELLAYFPPIKQYLVDKIENDFELPIKNININYSNDIKNKEITCLVKYFVENYLLILYAEKSIKNTIEEYNNQCDKYEDLLESNLNCELANIILESYQKKIQEDNIVDIFIQEKDKLINIFAKMKDNLKEDQENQEDSKILKKLEVKKYELLIEEMKDINIKFLYEKFGEYLQENDINSYAYSKADVILYLYQNDFL